MGKGQGCQRGNGRLTCAEVQRLADERWGTEGDRRRGRAGVLEKNSFRGERGDGVVVNLGR